jgi:hypothetical protein
MHDLNTINHINAYAAHVEKLKAENPGGIEERLVWPSDAPAIPSANPRLPATKNLKSWNRRLALLRSAQKRKAEQDSRVAACCARVLASDSLSSRRALIEALAEEL